MMSIGIYLTYPLVMYPVVEILLPSIQKRFPEKFEVVVELAFRYFLVAITCKYSILVICCVIVITLRQVNIENIILLTECLLIINS